MTSNAHPRIFFTHETKIDVALEGGGDLTGKYMKFYCPAVDCDQMTRYIYIYGIIILRYNEMIKLS